MGNFKRQLAFRIGIVLVIVSILIGFIIYFGNDIRNKSNLTFLKRSEITSRLGEIKNLTKLRESAKIGEPLKTRLDKALPKRDYLFSLPREFDKLASDRRLGFNFKFAEESKPDPNKPSQIKFAMTVQGKYNDILGFITDIETGPYFINLSNLDMIRSDGNFNASLNGEIFFNE